MLGSFEAPRPRPRDDLNVKVTIHSNAHHEEGVDPGLSHEHQVVVVVVGTNAVIDPGAVVVKPFDADTTHVAVAGARRTNDLTV